MRLLFVAVEDKGIDCWKGSVGRSQVLLWRREKLVVKCIEMNLTVRKIQRDVVSREIGGVFRF